MLFGLNKNPFIILLSKIKAHCLVDSFKTAYGGQSVHSPERKDLSHVLHAVTSPPACWAVTPLRKFMVNKKSP